MANEDQGRDDNFPDSADLWNGADGFMLLPLDNEVPHFGIRDNGPSSTMQLQASSSPTKNFYGETPHYIGHASAGSLSSMMSNATQHNNLRLSSLHDPEISGGVSALNRSQSYYRNHNVQNQDAPSGIRNQLHINRGFYQAESSGVKSFSALNRSQSYNLNPNLQKQDVPSGIYSQLDVNRGFYQSYGLNHSVQIDGISPDSGADLSIHSHGPHNWIKSGAPQVDNSNLLSLANKDSAGSRQESYASAGLYNGSMISFPPSRQETSHSPFIPIENGACGSYPQNLVPSGTIDCLALPNNGNRSLTGLTPGFDANTSLPSSRQLFDPNQLISTEHGRSPVMGNQLISRYIPTVSKAYQAIPSGLHSNNEFRSSESVNSWMPRLPSEGFTTSHRQQLTAEGNPGSHKTNQASQRVVNVSPSGRFNDFSITPDSAVFSSSRKRGGLSVTSEPRKLIRTQIVGPSRFQVNPSPPQSSILQIVNSNPSTSAFSSIPQQLIHQPLLSPKTSPLQNNSGNTVPFITPPSNRFSIDTNPRTAPATQQITLSKSTYSYPNSSPASTYTSHRPVLPSWYHSPSAMSPVHIADPFNSLERHSPQLGAAGKALPQTSMTLPHGISVGNISPMFGATGNSSTRPNHKAQGPLTIVPRKMATHVALGKALAPGPSNRNATSESAQAVVQRFCERQSNALAAFQNSAALHSSGTTSQMPYIKWQGVCKPEARGLKCLLCKRDLAYAPEGLVRIPACPPAVAVLPCGHVFHDHCLVAITPRDQRANPPCIPCSINEHSA